MASFIFVLFAIAYCITYASSDNVARQHSNVGIIGGHSISINQVPFMASLRLNGTYHWCGASIIHDQFVLTAAHCIKANREYKVLVGTDLVDEGGDLYDVETIITHNLYSEKYNDYDICLIKLKKYIVFGPKVDKIALADKSVKLKRGKLLQVTGWGYTGANKTVSQNLLQVSIPVVPTTQCQLIYMKAMRLITSRMVCAGGHGKDSCQGDSGGPLTLNNVQVGVTSFGSGCGDNPGVYTKIAPMLQWIKKTINQNL